MQGPLVGPVLWDISFPSLGPSGKASPAPSLPAARAHGLSSASWNRPCSLSHSHAHVGACTRTHMHHSCRPAPLFPLYSLSEVKSLAKTMSLVGGTAWVKTQLSPAPKPPSTLPRGLVGWFCSRESIGDSPRRPEFHVSLTRQVKRKVPCFKRNIFLFFI